MVKTTKSTQVLKIGAVAPQFEVLKAPDNEIYSLERFGKPRYY